MNSDTDPIKQLHLMAIEIINQLGPDAAAMLAQAILNIIDNTNNIIISQEEPVYKRDGKFIRRRTSK